MSVLFIRHAETAMAGRFCGHSDPEISRRGQEQIAELVRQLSGENLGAVYSSDLRRARSTAEAIATPRGLPVKLSPALREIAFGAWEGLAWDEIERADRAYAQRWLDHFPELPAPAGESFTAFNRRVLDEVERLVEMGTRDGDGLAVVTHGGVLRLILMHLCGCSQDEAWQRTQAFCCVVPYPPAA